MKKSILTLSMVTMFFLIPMLLQAQEQSLMLGPADLVPYLDDNDYIRTATLLYSEPGAVNRIFYAPIHLPNNVRLKRVVLFFYDFAANSVRLSVSRNNKYTGVEDLVIPSTDSSGTPGDSTITAYANWSYNRIQNTGYSYALRIWFGSSGPSLIFYGARVFYE